MSPRSSKRSSSDKKRRNKSSKQKQKQEYNSTKGYLALRGPVPNGDQPELTLPISHPINSIPQKRVRAIVDTGATMCTIRTDIATSLDLPVVGQSYVNHVGGQEILPIVLMRMYAYDSRNTQNESSLTIECITQTPDKMLDEMLFGMNAMVGGKLTVDLVNHKWEWKLLKYL